MTGTVQTKVGGGWKGCVRNDRSKEVWRRSVIVGVEVWRFEGEFLCWSADGGEILMGTAADMSDTVGGGQWSQAEWSWLDGARALSIS
jgi:hypothetical protein